jgi:hypothetical protein
MRKGSQQGDVIRGNRITGKAFSVDGPRVINWSGRHKGQEIILRGNAYCIVDIPLQYVLEQEDAKGKRH